MATSGITRRGIRRMLETWLQGATPPTQFYIALCTAATPPTTQTVTLGQLTEIAQGSGYVSGGYSISRNSTDWPTIDESTDAVLAHMRDYEATATGGALPLSGSDAAYAVILLPHATPSSREVFSFWSLGGGQHVSATQSMLFDDGKIRVTAELVAD